MREHDTYIIRSPGAEWAVRLNNETLGVFEKRTEAIQVAVVVAESSGRAGRVSEVLSEGANGELLPLWQIGHDAYSPLT